jgi:hypothetical protein
MAKGVPIQGKDPLGKAKYANVTESGDLKVQLSGNIVVEDAMRVTQKPQHEPSPLLDWKYRDKICYDMYVPEHDGTVWGRDYEGAIWNIPDVSVAGNTQKTNPIIPASVPTALIHPYIQDNVQKILVIASSSQIPGWQAIIVEGFNDDAPVTTIHQPDYITNSMCTDAYYDGLVNVVLVGEYGSGNTPKRLWLSKDGGVNWEIIKETTPKATGATQSHWHAVHYDRYSARIWAAEGDDANRALHWSDDFGETWHSIEGVYQPTLIKSFPNCVVFGHDEGEENTGLSVWMRNNDKRNDVVLRRVLTVNEKPSAYHYPDARQWAQRGSDAYVLFMRKYGTDYTWAIYKTNNGIVWTGVSFGHELWSHIDYLSGITTSGHIVARHRNSANPWGGNHLIYTKV